MTLSRVFLALTLTTLLTNPSFAEAARKGKKSKPKKAIAAQTVASKAPMTPQSLTDDRVTRVLRELKGRPLRAARSPEQALKIEIPAWTSKQEWLQAVYAKQLVDTSNATGLLSDKLIFYEVAKRELGERADRYLVKTEGLRAFLVRQGLVDGDGRLIHDGDRIEAALFQVFPAGVVARPAVGVAPRETGKGLFADADEMVAELLKPDTFLYRPEHRKKPIRSTVLDEIASGEAIVLQEDAVRVADARAPLKKKSWREVRIHTYEGRVLEDAVANFWVREGQITEEERTAATGFVAEFLSQLPASLISRQAWSFDVLVLDNGDLRIVDLVTNRGRKVGWSTYLDQPRVLGAYSRHFEQHAGVKFAGMGGMLLRHNAGNYFGYWGLRIERSHGFDKMLAWIPPWP